MKYDHNKNEIVSSTAEIPVIVEAGSIGLYYKAGNINTGVDAFGRSRVSQPFTLFDSSYRYQDNGKWNTSNNGNSSSTFLANNSCMVLSVGTNANDYVYRETKKVFSYQPGKSLLNLNTFTMSSPKDNLCQRIGYFSSTNGIFLEQANNNISIVKRSYTNNSLVETRIPQDSWSTNKLDGTDKNIHTNLDLSKTQIFWSDIEWLGVGFVRSGFVINGQFVVCHIFHHANQETNPYMTTACLPARCEILNSGITSSSSNLKQICSTVISEGGYELFGNMKSIGMDPPTANNYTLTTANIYYPVVSIRLKTNQLDAIVIPKNISIVGTTASDFRYKIIRDATITGGTWVSAGTDSAVEYNLTGTAQSGGTDLITSYLISTGSQSAVADLKDGNFQFQLERNSFTSTPFTFTLAVAAKANGDKILASINWEEVS